MTDKPKNIVSLIKKDPPPKEAKMTYIQALEEHIAQLDDEIRNQEVSHMMIVGEGGDGVFYAVLHGDSIATAIGMLEVTKINIVDLY